MLLFTREAWLTMLSYMYSVKTEIGGIGHLATDDFNTKYIDKVILLPQEVTGGSVDIEAAIVTEFLQGVPRHERKEWCFHWHTHPTFSTDPSQRDMDTYNAVRNLFPSCFLPLIINKDFDVWAQMWAEQPIPVRQDVQGYGFYEDRVSFKDLPVHCDGVTLESIRRMMKVGLSEEQLKQIDKDVEEFVFERVYTPPKKTESASGGTKGNIVPYRGTVSTRKPFIRGSSMLTEEELKDIDQLANAYKLVYNSNIDAWIDEKDGNVYYPSDLLYLAGHSG